MRIAATLLFLLTIACTSSGSSDSAADHPPDRLNPEGSPWGPPPIPMAEPEMLMTPWGVALVSTRGYSQVSLEKVEDAFYEAAKVCEPGLGAYQVQIYIEPELFKIGEIWSAGATDGKQIWVVGYYEAWDGRIARYDEMLYQELVQHVLKCGTQED